MSSIIAVIVLASAIIQTPFLIMVLCDFVENKENFLELNWGTPRYI